MVLHVNLTFAVFVFVFGFLAQTACTVYANSQGADAYIAHANNAESDSQVDMKHHPNENLKNSIVLSALAYSWPEIMPSPY